jgi:hypothetical protein
VVVFPQPHELSPKLRLFYPGNTQAFPEDFCQSATVETRVIHKSTAPYYN